MNEEKSIETTHTSSPEQSEGNAQPQRRKKAARACFHCQKAHLTCDDSRPCQRCIKRELSATCADGIRKKAKYLLDSNYDDNQAVFTQNGIQTQHAQNMVDTSGLFGYSIPQSGNYGFGSEAVNLEYSILSNMLSAAPTADALASSGPPAPPANGNVGKRESSGKRKAHGNTPESVYTNVTKPFSYTEGFHYLVTYVRERMENEHRQRIVRALATIRPSFIALIMNLTEEDLICMEKLFQRTLLEFEKLISFSGTPTVVWRRTGEIALVGKEFTLLTEWSREQLLGKTTYIYEVMENRSAVEYWEHFAANAFDNSGKSVMNTCMLLSPSGRPVPCTFCFTIKRDIFDIPLAIVGNFLPILS